MENSGSLNEQLKAQKAASLQPGAMGSVVEDTEFATEAGTTTTQTAKQEASRQAKQAAQQTNNDINQ